MTQFSKWAGIVKVGFDKHAPEILTGLGVAGMFASVAFAINATPKAMKSVKEKKKELNKTKLSFGEMLQASWKYYIPTTIMLASSTACVIGANSVSTRRSAALAAAYSLSETALSEYKAKVHDLIGDNKEKEVQAAIAQDKVAANPPSETTIINTGKGETLFMEALTGQYFRSDIEKIRKIENDLNREMRSSITISVNDVLAALGVRHAHKTYDNLGWDIDRHPLEFTRNAIVDDEMGVVVVIDYRYEAEPLV